MNNRGFTMIEVLLGLVILAIGLLALAGLQITSIRGNFFSNNLMQASYVAQERLEFLKNPSLTLVPPRSLELQEGSHNDSPRTISGIVFNRRYTVVNDPAGFIIISYVVSWNDRVDHNITFSTIRSPR